MRRPAAKGSEFTYERWRGFELRHGRISTATAIGYMSPEGCKFSEYRSPSYDILFADASNELGALPKARRPAETR